MPDQRNMLDQTKMTAPIPAVGAAGEQSENNKTNDIIPKDRKNNNSLHTLSMTELYDTTYPPKAAIIGGLLYAGAYLFVGAPKIGKSFFMAQLSYHVATGTSLWQYDVHPGEVLYLALEDDYARIQKRLYKMFGSEDTPNLHFATQSMTLGGGLLDQLEAFLAHHPETRLMIVDTLQKIREIGSDKYNYANDYEIVGRLKAFSDKHNLCLLIVHHTRKMESEDSFDMISGTNGLLGAADGAFILQKKKRTDTNAVLSVVGRDQQDQELLLQFDHEKCVWKLIKAETEVWRTPPDPVLLSVSKLVTPLSPEWRGTPSELHAQLADVPLLTHVLTRHLNANADLLYNDYGILYKTKRSHANRIIILTFEKAKV